MLAVHVERTVWETPEEGAYPKPAVLAIKRSSLANNYAATGSGGGVHLNIVPLLVINDEGQAVYDCRDDDPRYHRVDLRAVPVQFKVRASFPSITLSSGALIKDCRD